MGHRPLYRHFGVALTLVGVMLLAACSSDDSGDSQASGDSGDSSADVPALSISVGSSFIGYGPFWIAEGAGLFEEHGVELDVATYTGATTGSASLAAGQVDLLATSVGLAMAGVSEGLELDFVYGLSDFNYLSYSIVGQPGVESIEEIAALGTDCLISGPPAGVANLGFQNYAVEAFGLQCETNTQTTMPAILGLVASGQADLAVVFPTQAVTAADEGQVSILYDAFTATEEEGKAIVPTSFLFGGIVASPATIDEKSESLQRFINALDEARQMIADLPPEELAEITAQNTDAWAGTPVETLAEQWTLAKGYMIDGEITADDWQAALDGYSEYMEAPGVKPDDPTQSYDEVVDMAPLESARNG